jgi:hypothetical protein
MNHYYFHANLPWCEVIRAVTAISITRVLSIKYGRHPKFMYNAIAKPLICGDHVSQR